MGEKLATILQFQAGLLETLYDIRIRFEDKIHNVFGAAPEENLLTAYPNSASQQQLHQK